jgi:hypothetical protein
MINIKTLSDAQAELMQGGWSKGSYKASYMAQNKKPTWCGHGSNGSNGGPESITITNISMEVLQVSDSLALSIGHGFAVSEVEQELDIEVNVG